MTIPGIFGSPGPQARQQINTNYVFQGAIGFLPGGAYINGTKSRDITNTHSLTDQLLLNPGLLMGKITSTGLWSPSIPFGVTAGATTNGGTTVTLSAAGAVELVRRNGSTGTFSLIGPPTANGVARKATVTYSAVDQTTGVVTYTALGVNAVQTVNLVTAATGGSIRLIIQKADGTYALTPAAAWSATDATLLSNLQTALDTATGVANAIVATAINATDTDLGFVLTYSGTGYAGLPFALAQVHTLFTSNTGANVVGTTTGVDGRFVAGSFAGGGDGSEDMRSVVANGYGVTIGVDLGAVPAQAPWPWIPTVGFITSAQIINWPSDTGLQDYIYAQMDRQAGSEFQFSTKF